MTLALDTNILLLDADNITRLSEDGSHILLSEIVLQECDKFKSDYGELGYQARKVGRLLQQAQLIDVYTNPAYTKTTLLLDSTTVYIMSITNYETQPSDVSCNDKRIIESAILANKSEPVTFISNDTMARIHATTKALPVSDMKLVEDINLDFTITIEVPATQFSLLNNSQITSINPNHQPCNYNYIFNCDELGYSKLGTIKANGLINIIGKEQENKLRKSQKIAPLNSGHLFLSAAIQDPTTDLIIAEAAAGSGKTVTALSNAMGLINKNTPYDSILYIRASINDVEDVEEIGFLPGTLEEKTMVYLHPLYDTLDFIARSELKSSNKKGLDLEEAIQVKREEYLTKYNIQAMTTLGMRGRTFTNSIIIIDEVQNQSQSALQKVLTRFGKNCKVILTGSNKQIDNKFITKYNNGLSVLLGESAKEQDLISLHVVPLDRVVRSPLAEWSEKVYSKDNH